MKFDNCTLQICRNDNASLDIGEFELGRKTGAVCKFISDQCRQKAQDILFGKGSLYHREYIIHDLEDGRKACCLCLIKEHSQYSSLTFCTSHIQTCCITDTAVGCYLYTVQMVSINCCLLIFRSRIWFLDRCVALSSQF